MSGSHAESVVRGRDAAVLGSRYGGSLSISFLIALTVAVLFLRRPDQFLHPYIWVEEGKYVLREYLENGFLTLFRPLAGYSVLASKIVAYIAFKASILWAPEIALALIVAFTCAVIVSIAASPTHLRWPVLCAIAVLLVPTDAEVFAVSSYAIWWAGLLLLVALFWDPGGGREWLRWLYIVLGGLSSPLIGAVTVLLAVRAVMDRRRSEYCALAFAALCAVVQYFAMRSQGVRLSMETFGFTTFQLIVEQYIGGFFYSRINVYLAFAVFGLLVAAGFLVRSQLDRYFYLLVLTFFVTSATVSLRMPIGNFSGIDQFVAGPRYFFYPFILLSWIMIWIASLSKAPVKLVIGAGFAFALLAAGPALSRRHDAIDWKQQITMCAQSTEYRLPFHYIGRANETWYDKYTGDECRKLLMRSIF